MNEFNNSRGSDDLLQKDIEKEAAVKDERHWVRLTRLCNQRCKFCLDSWNHNGTYVDSGELKDYIQKGREQHKTRLILSGGEPTIHPDYVKFIRYGREVGYDWVQTVTNGMLFSYPKFARAAVQAGLNEVTFSIHGHTAKLHDALTGTPLAFETGIQGIRNLQAIGGVVINVDIVVNKQNYKHLPEILDFFLDMGVMEFDLLYVIPFGRGFDDFRKHLFFDLDDDAYPYFQKAFEKSKIPGVFLWTNRLPVNYLENYEHLIQDPHKLHYEINGGRHNFEGLARWGVPPDCFGERCDHCFLHGICRDTLMPYQGWLKENDFGRVRVHVDETSNPSEKKVAKISGQKGGKRWYVGESVDQIVSSLETWKDSAKKPKVIERVWELNSGDLLTADEATSLPVAIDQWVVSTAGAVNDLIGTIDGIDSEKVSNYEVVLNQQTMPVLLSNLDFVDSYADRLIFTLRNHEYVSESRSLDPTPEDIASLATSGRRFRNVPECLTGYAPEGTDRRILDSLIVDSKGLIDLDAYVHHYVVEEYYSKSRRCDSCIKKDDCEGLHINYLRNHGYKMCAPINDKLNAEVDDSKLAEGAA
jgi:pyruvate-formate lyase-activating enzyme